MVLLKNDGILPLDKKRLKTIGVIGPNANSRLALKGNCYGTSSRYITILEGIQDEAQDEVRVLYASGCELVNDRTEPLAQAHDRFVEAVTVAEHSEVVILCIGLDETIEGEELDEGNHCGSGDKVDLELPEIQTQLIQKLTETGTPLIVCMLSGSAMNLGYCEQNNAAVLQVWYPGASGGTAVADILFGNTSPSGKLPITFYRDIRELPEFTDYRMGNRTYRYYQGVPLYPFGYGLTYGKIICTEAVLENNNKDEIEIRAMLINKGLAKTEDVLQVYLKNQTSEYAVPNGSLCAFLRVELEAGEEKEINMKIPKTALWVYDEAGKTFIDGRCYELYVGMSQPDQRSIELLGAEPIRIPLLSYFDTPC